MPRIRVSIEDAHALWKDEGATALDVVDTHAYGKTTDQIEGAIRIDPEEIRERFNELPTGKPVVAYCT